MLLNLLSSPISTLAYIRQKQGLNTMFQVVQLTLSVVAVVAGGIAKSPILAIALLGGLNAGVRLVFTGWSLSLAGCTVRRAARSVRDRVPRIALAVAPAVAAFFIGAYLHAELVTVLGALVSLALVWLVRPGDVRGIYFAGKRLEGRETN
jgi:hypothetical protein